MAPTTDEGFFSTRDGLRLFSSTLKPADPAAAPAHIALVHGYAEHFGRHTEVSAALTAQGYVVHGLDVRGHGQSGGKRAHVDRFEDYLGDLELFLGRVREAAQGKPVFFLGHSHGCLIGARYLLDHPDAVQGAIFSAPYFRLKMAVPAIKIWAGKLIGRILPALPMTNAIHVETLCRDKAIQDATLRDPLYLKIATPRWFTESSAAQETVLRRATEFTTPLLVLTGGADPIADTAAAKEFFDAATSKDKEYVCYDGFLHEIFHEPERARVFADLTGWIAKHTQAKAQRAPAQAARA